MRIGELARTARVKPSAIRFYERTGLMPEPARTPSGYRDYDLASLDRLAFIRAGQAIGLTLAELREIIAFRERGDTPCAHVIALIERHAEQVSDRIAELLRIQRDLHRLAARAAGLNPANCAPSHICHVVIDPADIGG